MGADVTELRNIWKAFGEKQVLRGMDLALPEGETTCLMGPSGCGKTTLLRILLGLETADEGEISGMEGQRVSAVFQEDRLLTRLTAEGNLRFVAEGEAAVREIPALLRELGLGDETGPAAEFSGGMKRRLAIARALLAEHTLLVLDEPFRGLDQETKERAMETVRRRSAGKTVLLVTHDEGEARAMSGHIIRMQ
ncbi:MAG: ATP-binding cassette domain-containing protein [Oscillospiraceae bacterium]